MLGDSHAEPTFEALTYTFPNASIGYITRFGKIPSLASPEWSRIIDLARTSDSIQTVVLSGFWAQYTSEDFSPDLREVLGELSAGGKTVFVLDDWPAYPFLTSDCASRRAPIIPARRCTIDASSEREVALSVRESLTAATQGLANVQVLDTRSSFCDPLVCSIVNGSAALYADQDHLNVTGAHFLGSQIKRLYPEVGTSIAGSR